MKTEDIAIILSILAFVVSVVSPIFEYLWNYKINITNLEAEYFRNVYGKYLMNDIPRARENITFNGERILGTDSLIDVLRNIRIDSLYFKCMHLKFYEELLKNLQNLEDYIILNENEVDTSGKYLLFDVKVKNRINIIYSVISEQYIGKRRILPFYVKK